MATDTQNDAPWTTKRLLEWTTNYLEKAQVDQPRLASEILLAHVLDCPRIQLYTNFDHCPDDSQLAAFRAFVKRASCHEPIQYLTGKANFYSLTFNVRPGVLIPRPETELLVTAAIDFLRLETNRPTVDILDLGVGSGCIAVAIAANVVEAEVLAVDIDPHALQIAAENLQAHDLQSRITLLESDLFAQVDQAEKTIFDLIVANPPYISAPQFRQLSPVIRDHEPADALLAGADGLDVIRRIISQAEPYLADSGALMIEIAYDQADQVTALLEQAGYLSQITTLKDHAGHPRGIKSRKK